MLFKKSIHWMVMIAFVVLLLATPQSALAWGGCTSSYNVRGGDTLWSIAKNYGTTVAAMRQANPNMGYWIYAGQTLCMPGAYQGNGSGNNYGNGYMGSSSGNSYGNSYMGNGSGDSYGNSYMGNGYGNSYGNSYMGNGSGNSYGNSYMGNGYGDNYSNGYASYGAPSYGGGTYGNHFRPCH